MREPHGGTVTFVFTDIEGSTRLVQQFKDRWPDVRSAHRRIVRTAFEAHGGDEVDTQGDSFFYVFGRARDAALAAAEAQRGLAAHPWPEGGQVRIRIGMHTGEPVVSDEGYHGVGVHRAARIMSAGHGGQVLLSEATAAVLRDEEVEGVGVRDLGVHRLKDLDRPERVYQLVASGLDAAFPRIRTAGEEKAFYRRPLVIGAAAGVLAAAVAIPVFAFAGGSGGGDSLAAEDIQDNAVSMVDESSSTLAAQATGVDEPHSAAAGAGAVWVTSGAGSLARIDPQTHTVTQTIDVGEGPEGLAVNGSDVWVANSLDGTVSRVSATTNQETEPYTVGNSPTGVAIGTGSVWVTNAGDGTVTQLNAENGDVQHTIDLHAPVRGIAFGESSIWVSDPVGNAVIRVRVPSGSSTRIDVGSGPTAIAYGNGQVWVANSLAGTVSRIDPDTNLMAGTFPVGAAPSGIAVTPEAVWVSDEVEGTLVRVNPSTGAVEKRVALRGRPEGVAATGGSVWVGVQAAGDAHRGGNLRLITPLLDFIDPALAYYYGTWDIVSVTSDGLVGFKRVGGIDGNTVVPDLATSIPQPSDGGRAYSFQLERGIRFSNGKEVTPADVRASFERVFRAYGYEEAQRAANGKLIKPKRDISPAVENGYFTGIVGADTCVRSPRNCNLSRGIVTSDADRSVTFHLVKPDPDFLYKLALPFGAIVPRGAPIGGKQPLSGTGPYKVDSFTPHRYVRLVRNPYFHAWSPAAQPAGLPDTIELSTNLRRGRGPTTSERAAFLATVAGRADAAEAGVPPEALKEARTQYPAQLHVTPQAGTAWIYMNTEKPPFSNPHARRALAYALDRSRMVENEGGSDLAAPTCQILPPGLPGYKPYCPFTAGPETGRWVAPDLARARAEVAQSRTRGARVRLIATDETPALTAHNMLVANTLRMLGYRVSVTHFAKDAGYFGALYGDAPHVDAAALGWTQDYPAPSNFFAGLACPASPYFCSRSYDRQRASTTAASIAGGSMEPWTKLDRATTASAVVIPFLNLKSIDFVSKRVGNYQHHPVYDLLIDQLWVR